MLKKIAKCMWNFQCAFLLCIVLCLMACSDDSSGTEYSFDKEILEMNVLRSCKNTESTDACYRLRFRYPIETEKLLRFLVWIDTTVIDDTTRSVSKYARNNPTITIDYNASAQSYYDTLDLTDFVKDYRTYDSLQVAIWPEYSNNDSPGEVQRVFLHFGDDISPSIVTLQDSVFMDGAVFDWSRPTDQVDYYSPEVLNGPIAGYNIVVYALNEDEDIRNAKVTLIRAEGEDSTGSTYYLRNYRYRTKNDSVWLDSTSTTDKRYLRLAVFDGEGFSETDSLNRFRLIIRGLRSESKYTIGITSYDSAGNYSGSTVSAESNQMFITTDKVAPLMATKLFFFKDSSDANLARLDSNNRVRIFFSRSIDPFSDNGDVTVDTVLSIPDTCIEYFCYRGVESYQIDRYTKNGWEELTETGGTSEERYTERYEVAGDSFEIADFGSFVVDTVRWVSPGDRLILRVRAIDSSGYYSTALIDTLYVSKNDTSGLECPEGFLPVVTDSSKFCMERFEHIDSTGAFITNVLHSEAKAICEGVLASGFTVSLCKERDWELACLSGGTSSYGVIEESLAASEYLYTNCNVATGDSVSAADMSSRSYKCASKYGLRDLPGQYQEWVLGRSDDTLELLKGSSYRPYSGLDRESIALCTNRFFPYYTRPAYVKDTTVYIYRSGTVVDTSFTLDTTRTLYKKLEQKDFSDTLQFFAVVNPSTGDTVGYDYAPIDEYRNGGEAWIKELAGDFTYVASYTETVFLLNGTAPYRKVAAFYRNTSISFRCCAYPE